MKAFHYISLLTAALCCSCSSMQNMNNTIEDDIYYVPDEKPLMVKEVENITGQSIDMNARPAENYSSSTGKSALVINREKGTTERISTSDLANRAEATLNDASAGEMTTLYENSGYWIGGFKGTDNDMAEAARIISQYPQGFGFIANGQDIALNLSFSPDWNVYTDNGRYWWFPSSSNVELYNTFLFGTYPKYIWTVIWNQPYYDSWTFDSQFNFGLNFGWGGPGWSFGLGWNNGFYRPWYSGWYGSPYWGGWYDPWWGGGWYPGWGYPHWHYPHWGGHYPNWGPPSRPPLNNMRPGASINNGIRPGSGLRPGNNNRPGSGVRPGSSLRPGTATRPGTNSIRPGTTNRPGSTVRPGMSRPGSSVTRPGSNQNSNIYRPGSATRPGSSLTRPSTTRPSRNQYTRPSVRPGSSNTNRSGNVRNYNRQQNNYRPSYNNNRSSGSSRSTYSPSRSGSYSPSRSGSVSRPSAPPQRQSGGRR